MAFKLGEAFVDIGARLGNLTKGVGEAKGQVESFVSAAKGAIRSLGEAMEKVGARATIGFTIPLVSGAVAAARAAGEQQTANAKLAGVLNATGHAAGFTAEALQAQAKALSQVSVFTDEALVNVEALLATFREVRGDTFKRATAAIVDMASVTGDLESAALAVGKALTSPTSGIRGLTQAGVIFTESQKDQIKAMTEVGNLAGAQILILGELESRFSGVAAAINAGFSGSMAMLRKQTREVFETIGGALIPTINALATIVKAVFLPVAQFVAKLVEMNPVLSAAAGLFGIMLAAIGPLLVVFGALTTIIGTVLPIALTALIGRFVILNATSLFTSGTLAGMAGVMRALTFVTSVASVAVSGLSGAFSLLWKTVTGPIGVIIGIVAVLATLIGFFVGMNRKTKESADGLAKIAEAQKRIADDKRLTFGLEGIEGSKSVPQRLIPFTRESQPQTLGMSGINFGPPPGFDTPFRATTADHDTQQQQSTNDLLRQILGVIQGAGG